MAQLELEPLSAIAQMVCGEPVVVQWRDLSADDAMGQAGVRNGKRVIYLDPTLASWRRDHFNRTFWHELAHAYLKHSKPGDAIEMEADAWADRFEATAGAGLPWNLAHTERRWEAMHLGMRGFFALLDELGR